MRSHAARVMCSPMQEYTSQGLRATALQLARKRSRSQTQMATMASVPSGLPRRTSREDAQPSPEQPPDPHPAQTIIQNESMSDNGLTACPCCGQPVEPPSLTASGKPIDPLFLLWGMALQRLSLPSTRMLLSQQSELVELMESPAELLAVVEVPERWAGFTKSRRRLLELALGEVLARPVAVEVRGDGARLNDSGFKGSEIAEGFSSSEPPQTPCPPGTPRSRLSDWARLGVVGCGVSSSAIAKSYRRLFGTSTPRDPAEKGPRVYSYREVCLCMPAAGYHTPETTGVI